MAMFEKSMTTEAANSPGTVVGANVKLTGTLKDVNDITVHGQVEGEIISDRIVTIAETAKVKGPITATAITVAGIINGAITTSERCELLPSARVTGSITTSDLSIKSGALFNGKATMTESQTIQSETNKDAVIENIPDKLSVNQEDEIALTISNKETKNEKVDSKIEEMQPQTLNAPKAELED